MIESTVDASAINQQWDAVIIGCGPAGSMVAHQLASHHKRVLMIDKAQFPRSKVCGCCINSGAADALSLVGLGRILEDSHATRLQSLILFDSDKKASLNLPRSFSLSRNALDTALLTAAIGRGAHFLPGTTGKVKETGAGDRKIDLESDLFTGTIHSKIVIVADGLNGRSLDGLSNFDSSIQAGSRFGMGAILPGGPEFYQAGNIYMACGSAGYVGLVRLEDDRIDIAAAMDRDFSRAHGGPAFSAAAILEESGLPVPLEIHQVHWSGTDSLSRIRKQLAAERIFVIGDACGYPEPFTGEGISWALWSAIAVSNLVLQGIDSWEAGLGLRWQRIHGALIRKKHLRSAKIALALRDARLRHIAISVLAGVPMAADAIMNKLTGKDMRKTFQKLAGVAN